MSPLLKYTLLFSLVISACTSGQRLGQKNVAEIYKKGAFDLASEFVLYNQSDSVSNLFYDIQTENFLFKKKEGSTNFAADIEIRLKLFPDNSTKEFLLIHTEKIYNLKQGESPNLSGKISFKAENLKSYLVEITVTDVNRNNSQTIFHKLHKNNVNSRNNFFLKDSENKNPLFRNYVGIDETFSINYNNKNHKKLFVRFYDRNFPIAAPPFLTENRKPFQYKSDSIFVLDIENGTLPLSLHKKGFYHFQADSSINNSGYTIYIFNEHFPELKTSQNLIYPLLYLTSKEEFEKLISASNPKEALDKFWLDNAGNPDRAKTIISKYYNRVKDANIYFSSYTEGWKTDRGIIYIIFGEPNVVYKSINSEIWIYGEENNLMSLNFSFFSTDNPFTDNDYTLDRSEIYRASWYQAVDVWRQGRVY